VVTTAFDVASLTDQLAAVKDVVAAETEQYKVVQRQFEVGAASKADVLSQLAQLAQARAVVPGLEKALPRPNTGRCAGRAYTRRCKFRTSCWIALRCRRNCGHGAGEIGPAAPGRAGR